LADWLSHLIIFDFQQERVVTSQGFCKWVSWWKLKLPWSNCFIQMTRFCKENANDLMTTPLTDKFLMYLVTTYLPVRKILIVIHSPGGSLVWWSQPLWKSSTFCFLVDYLNNDLIEKICFNWEHDCLYFNVVLVFYFINLYYCLSFFCHSFSTTPLY